jgi:predicted RNase H-like HicB family nuclease
MMSLQNRHVARDAAQFRGTLQSRFLACIGFALATVGHCRIASCYRTAADLPAIASQTPVRWPDGQFTYVLYNQAPPGVLFSDYEDTVEQALLTWTLPQCTSYSILYFGPTATRAQPGDGVSTIEFVQSGWVARGYDPADKRHPRRSETLPLLFAFLPCILSEANMVLTIEFEREDDGRWIAEVPQLPGVLAYGDTQEDATQHVRALAFRVIADQIDSGELDARLVASVSFAA